MVYAFKKELMGFLFLIGTALPSQAKVSCDWSDSFIPEDKQRTVDECVQRIAKKYLEKKYADLGELDFVNASESYIIRIDEHQGQPEYWLGADGGTLFLDIRELSDMIAFEVIVFHEFSHAYDWTLKDRADNENFHSLGERAEVLIKREKMTKIVQQTESRALQKEQRYVEEIKERIPEKLYTELQQRYRP